MKVTQGSDFKLLHEGAKGVCSFNIMMKDKGLKIRGKNKGKKFPNVERKGRKTKRIEVLTGMLQGTP